jgi:DNA-binding MarR family transcriptional regulator
MMSIGYQVSMTDPSRTPDRIADLLVHVGRAARSEDGRSDLTAAQWTCLRFFARANGSTRTPSGFASYQATTRGTASQIIKTLEARGLITRRRSDRDGRSVRFDLTEAGRALLSRDPLRDLVDVIGTLEAAERVQVLDTLSRVVSAVADLRAGPAFGTCLDCSHFSASDGSGYCACMAAELAADDTTKLCASFRGPTPTSQSQGQSDGRA